VQCWPNDLLTLNARASFIVSSLNNWSTSSDESIELIQTTSVKCIVRQ